MTESKRSRTLLIFNLSDNQTDLYGKVRKRQMKRNRFHTAKTNIIKTISTLSPSYYPPLVKNKADKNENDFEQIIFATENTTQICVFWGESD